MIKDGKFFCDKCGKMLEPNETVCSDCGIPVSSSVSGANVWNLCSVLGIIVLVFGIIGSIYLAYRFGIDVEQNYDTFTEKILYEENRNFVTTAIIFCSGAFGTLIVYAILSTLGEIKNKLK